MVVVKRSYPVNYSEEKSVCMIAALVPGPRLNLTRFHGMFAPNFKHRARIIRRRCASGDCLYCGAATDREESGGSAEARVASAVRNKSPVLVGVPEKMANYFYAPVIRLFPYSRTLPTTFSVTDRACLT